MDPHAKLSVVVIKEMLDVDGVKFESVVFHINLLKLGV